MKMKVIVSALAVIMVINGFYTFNLYKSNQIIRYSLYVTMSRLDKLIATLSGKVLIEKHTPAGKIIVGKRHDILSEENIEVIHGQTPDSCEITTSGTLIDLLVGNCDDELSPYYSPERLESLKQKIITTAMDRENQKAGNK